GFDDQQGLALLDLVAGLDEGRGLRRRLQIGGADHRRLHLFAGAGDDGGGVRRHGGRRSSGGGRSGDRGGGGGVLNRSGVDGDFARHADAQFAALDLDFRQIG